MKRFDPNKKYRTPQEAEADLKEARKCIAQANTANDRQTIIHLSKVCENIRNQMQLFR